MKNTLETWYSLNRITPQQYYQLIDLVNPHTEYSLDELLLLTKLPDPSNLPDPTNELDKFQRARDDWEEESSLSDWLDEPQSNFFFSKEFLFTCSFFVILLIFLNQPKNYV